MVNPTNRVKGTRSRRATGAIRGCWGAPGAYKSGATGQSSSITNTATNMTTSHLSAFTAAMISACESALDAEVFYQDEFAAFVVTHMGGYDCQAVLMEVLRVSELGVEEAKAARRHLAERVKAAPRGHYGIVERPVHDGTFSYAVLISDGTGELATGGRFDSHATVPAGDKVLQRMIGYEIFLCRKAVEADRLLKSNISALAELGFKEGMELRDLKVSGETKLFSRATIESVNPENGSVRLLLTRRGTAKRWVLERGAKRLGEMVGLLVEAPNKHPFVVVVKVGEDVLNAGEAAG